MRKTIFFSVLLSLVMGFTSCDKDDDKDDANDLAGTIWQFTESDDYGSYIVTLTFNSGGTGVSTEKRTYTYDGETEEETETDNFTWSYKKPNVTLTVGNETINGTVSDNKMTFVMEDGDDDYYSMTFTKIK
jgi:hypothetical protein